jgi:sensor histidine kinase YesM
MLQNTRELEEDNIRLQKKVKELEDYVRQMEMTNLMLQIKPHFIFNTLNLIARLIFLNRNAEATEITYAFSKLLRFSLEKKDWVRMYEELQHVRNYFLIQKSRYQEKINVVLDIAEVIMISLVPPLILQPIVENSISHGLEPNGGGEITISGKKAEGDIVITVTDNGKGFPFVVRDNQVNESGLATDVFAILQGKGSIGLTNVQRRLALAFGGSYGLVVNSQPGLGTQISLRLPFSPDTQNQHLPSFWFD